MRFLYIDNTKLVHYTRTYIKDERPFLFTVSWLFTVVLKCIKVWKLLDIVV